MHSTTIKPAEILAAAPDFFALQMGAAPTSTTHPLAESLSARKIAHAIGAKLRKPTNTEGDMAVMARGLRSADFARLLANGAKNVTIAAFDAAAQEHLQFAAVTPVEGFKAETLPAIDGDLDMQPMSEQSHCSVRAVPYVLEMRQGWFKLNHILPGMKIRDVQNRYFQRQ